MMTAAEEIEFLRSRVVELETKLNEVDNTDIAFMFSLPPMLEKLFKLLLKQPRVTTEMIVEGLGAEVDAKMTVFRLRKYLKPHDIDVKSKRHLGYWIEPAEKERLFEKMRTTQPSN